MHNVPDYRIRELANFFKAVTGKDCMDVDSAEMYLLTHRINSTFHYEIKFRYKLQALLHWPIKFFTRAQIIFEEPPLLP